MITPITLLLAAYNYFPLSDAFLTANTNKDKTKGKLRGWQLEMPQLLIFSSCVQIVEIHVIKPHKNQSVKLFPLFPLWAELT